MFITSTKDTASVEKKCQLTIQPLVLMASSVLWL